MAIADTLHKDFFISYSSPDREHARWIAWTLEETGYSTVYDEWDFGAGRDFVGAIHRALIECHRMIAVLSRGYLLRPYPSLEWQSFLHRDPSGSEGLLIPVRIEEFAPDGIFATRVYVDFVGKTEEEARQLLLAAVRGGRRKPKRAPPFRSATSRRRPKKAP